MLEGTNLFDNWAFIRRTLTGDPEGISFGMPEEPEGYYIYMSSANGDVNSMTAQNTQVISVDEPSYILDDPYFKGHAPRTPLTASRIGAPPQPDVVVIPAAGTGFTAGVYQLAYSWVELNYDGTFNHTPLSLFNTVTLLAAQRIRLTLPSSVPNNGFGIGIWMTPANGATSTARLQEIIPLRDILQNPDHTMTGPFTWGRTAPTRNETVPPTPLQPKVKHVRGSSPGVAGLYFIEVAFVTDQGTESERSARSYIEITKTQAKKNIHIEVNPQDAQIPGITGYRVYVSVQKPEEDSFRQLIYTNLTQGGAGRPVRFSERVVFSGELARLGPQKTTRVLSGWGNAEQSETSSVTDIEEGLAVPEGTYFETLTAVGRTPIASGVWYWIAISYWVRGEETVVCAPKRYFLTAGASGFQVFFQDKINLLRNSQFNQIAPNGAPYGWELTGVAGGVNSGTYVMSNGTMQLRTVGAKTGVQTTPVLGGAFTVDRTKVYTIGGTYITEWLAGTMEAYLNEYNSAGTLVRSTLLKSINDNGEVDFEKRFGPNDVYTDSLPFLDATITAKLVIQFTGATRNGTITVKELYVHDHPNRIRRFEKVDDPLSADNPDPPPAQRWRQARNKVIAPAPSSRRRGAAFTPLSMVDFGEATPSAFPPTGWTLYRDNPSGTVAEVRADAAVDGAYGARIAKTNATSSMTFLYKQFTPTNRTRLAVRWKCRINQIPSVAGSSIILGAINTTPSASYIGSIFYIALYNNGLVNAVERDIFGNFYSWTLSNVIAGDVLDLELIISNGNSAQSQMLAGAGKNGTTRTFPGFGVVNQTGWNPQTIQIGPSYITNPAATFSIDFDSITVTEAGDSLVAPGSTPGGEALPKPDAPFGDVVAVGTEINFNDGTFPSGWTQLRTPADGTTTLAVQTASSIDATQPVGQRYGIRFADTGTATTAQVAMQRSVTTDVTDTGDIAARCRFRIVTRPTSGNVRVLGIRDASNNTLAYAYLDSTGALYARANSTGTGSTPPDVVLARGLVNDNIVTLELILSDTGTIAGTLNAWCSVGGTGTKTERRLMGQPQGVDWSGGMADKVLIGIVTESIASVTSSFDFDNILLTETGEMNYRLYTDANEPINQAYCFYPKDQPVRNDLWAKDARIAVKPGRTYTAGIWARHSDVPTASFPFTFHAYDLTGTAHPLGSLYDSVGGAIGTVGWTYYTKTFVIPKKGELAPNGEIYETDCHEVRLSSPGVSSGEYVCQEFAFSPGFTAQSENIYPLEGVVWITLDSEIPYPAPAPMQINSMIENLWLDVASIIDIPEGTTVAYEYGSSDALAEPSIWYTAEEDMLDHPGRYAHLRLTFSPDTTRRLTPILRSGSPWLETATVVGGSEHIAKLLRGDGTEFPGGAYVYNVFFPAEEAEYDIRRPRGRTRRHRRTEAIERLPSFTIRLHSERAYQEFKKTYLEDEFMLEVHDRRMRFIFVETLDFSLVGGEVGVLAPPVERGTYYAAMEAEVSEIEIIETLPMTSIYERIGLIPPLPA